MSDEQLLEALSREDATAQRQLYDRYAGKMFGVCMRYAKSTEEAEDFLQDGFIRVFRKLSSYKGEGSLEGWIRKVMVNTCLEHLRSQKISWENIGPLEEPVEDYQIPDHLEVKDLLQLIRLLPPGYGTIFNLFAIEGYGHKEIGEMLGISENTSKSQYSRARAQLLIMIRVHYKVKVG